MMPTRCGVQDPRIVYNKATETYILAYTTFGYAQWGPGPLCHGCCGGGGAGLGIATSKDPSNPNGWTRHGYNQLGKSAALLVRETGPHYAFYGIPSINLAVSWDLIHWNTTVWNWLIADDAISGFVEAGAPPQLLSDGNYLMTYNILGPCNCWGAGYLILDGTDPSIILQRTSVQEGGPLIWPELPWETTNTSSSDWEPLKCCIGATNSLQPLGNDQFIAHYASGDSVGGGSIISVRRT